MIKEQSNKFYSLQMHKLANKTYMIVCIDLVQAKIETDYIDSISKANKAFQIYQDQIKQGFKYYSIEANRLELMKK